MNDSTFDFEDFSFWDVNDDSLFAEHEVYLASLLGSGQGGEGSQQTPNDIHASNNAGSKKIARFMLSKNDKRRLYAKMFSEAFNSGDSKQLFQFLEQCCTANCEVIEKCVVKENPYLPKHVEIHGVQAIHQYWSSLFVTIPDCLMIMLETKLRIRNHNNHNNNNNNGRQNNPNIPPGNTTNITNSSEGSSIVSSFSFTGTKLYNLAIEGAVMHNNGSVTTTNTNDFQPISHHNGHNGHGQHNNSLIANGPSSSAIGGIQGIGLDSAVANSNINNSAFRMGQYMNLSNGGGMSTNAAAIAAVAASGLLPLPVTNAAAMAFTGGGGSGKMMPSSAPPIGVMGAAAANVGKNRKRGANTDWPSGQDSSFPNPTSLTAASSSTGTGTAGSGGGATNSNNATWDINSTNINDRYNIFLHPPRRFSTLAGTPYGGTSGSGNYFHMKNHTHQLQSTLQHTLHTGKGNNNQNNEHVELNHQSKIAPGRYIDQEGYINFLGTLTMTLDYENKISKFEFLYSHMD